MAIDPPSTDLNSVLKLRRKYLKAFQDHAGETLDTGVMASLSQTLSALTKPTKAVTPNNICDESEHDKPIVITKMTEAVYRMMSEECAGLTLTDELVDYLALRFAGNFVKCRGNSEPESWRGQQHERWSIAEVVDSQYHVTPTRHIPGAELTFLVWSGAPAGKKFNQFFTDGSLARMATLIGLMPRRKRRTLHYREFVRLKMLLNLQPSEKLTALQYREQGSLNNRNKHRVESRLDKVSCKCKTDLPCHFCPRGYKSCVNGAHPKDYVQRMCKYGHKGWFASRRGSLCLKCQASRWWTSHH